MGGVWFGNLVPRWLEHPGAGRQAAARRRETAGGAAALDVGVLDHTSAKQSWRLILIVSPCQLSYSAVLHPQGMKGNFTTRCEQDQKAQIYQMHDRIG